MLRMQKVKTIKLMRFVVLFAISLSGVVAATETPAIKSLSVSNPSSLLFVGNSYLYYSDSLHDHVRWMVDAAGLYKGVDLKYRSVTINGARLVHHDVKSYLEPGRIGVDVPFQVVVLQGHSTAALSEENHRLFETSIKQYSNYIVNAGGEVALYMTPAYVRPHEKQRDGMMRDVEQLYVSVGNSVDALVIPVGLAFEEAYRRRPDIQLHKAYDGSHPALLGTYLGAATVFASLYDQSPVGNSYDYYGAIDQATARFLQEVAKDTVDKFYQRK